MEGVCQPRRISEPMSVTLPASIPFSTRSSSLFPKLPSSRRHAFKSRCTRYSAPSVPPKDKQYVSFGPTANDVPLTPHGRSFLEKTEETLTGIGAPKEWKETGRFHSVSTHDRSWAALVRCDAMRSMALYLHLHSHLQLHLKRQASFFRQTFSSFFLLVDPRAHRICSLLFPSTVYVLQVKASYKDRVPSGTRDNSFSPGTEYRVKVPWHSFSLDHFLTYLPLLTSPDAMSLTLICIIQALPRCRASVLGHLLRGRFYPTLPYRSQA